MTFLLLWLTFACGGVPQAEGAPMYEQTYAIYIRGGYVGNETVKETVDKDGNRVVISQHELVLADTSEPTRLAFETTSVFAKGNVLPQSYSCRYLSGNNKDYYDVTVKSGRITRILSRAGAVSETSSAAPPGTVILDVNVYHQYDELACLYDFKKRGRQTFNYFLPVVGTAMPLVITWVEDSKLEYDRGSIPVRHFKVEFVGLRAGNYSTDTKGRLVRLIIAEQGLEVVRKDLVPEKH